MNNTTMNEVRAATLALVHATKIPDGWVAECLRPLAADHRFSGGNLTKTEVIVERGADSYDLAHLSAEAYSNRCRFYAVELGEEFQHIVSLAEQRVRGDFVEYDKYVAEHGLFKTNAHVKLLEQEGVYLAGTPNLSIYGPASTPGYPNPFLTRSVPRDVFDALCKDPETLAIRKVFEAFWDDLETSGYVKVRCYLEEEDVNWYFDCPTSKLAVFVPHD